MIEPILHRILVRPDKIEEIDPALKQAKAAGIVIPELESRKREQASVDSGTVVSFGPTVFRDFNTTNPLSVGDYIAYARHSGKRITDPDTKEEFVLLNDEDVVCIYKKVNHE